jgi:hypothetical protein
MIEEQRIQYARHCCQCVIRRGEAFALFERVPGSGGSKAWFGPIAHGQPVKRVIDQYNDRSLRGTTALP